MLDRRGSDREQPDWLQQVWADPSTRVLHLQQGQARIVETPASAHRLVYDSPAGPVPDGLIYLGAAEARTLGQDTDEGTVHLVAASSEEEPEGDAGWSSLWDALSLLNPFDLGVLTQAVAITKWHTSAVFCGACGHRTEVRSSGWMRRCEHCPANHFPRMNPAIITAVVDDQDRLLLGSSYRWEERRFSTFAGFVEAGEALEDAVVREVREEAGVVVRDAQYLGSQPWPFPSQLMLGFIAHADDGEQARADDEEIRSVRWFTREELTRAEAAGEIILPPQGSISRALISHWQHTPLP